MTSLNPTVTKTTASSVHLTKHATNSFLLDVQLDVQQMWRSSVCQRSWIGSVVPRTTPTVEGSYLIICPRLRVASDQVHHAKSRHNTSTNSSPTPEQLDFGSSSKVASDNTRHNESKNTLYAADSSSTPAKAGSNQVHHTKGTRLLNSRVQNQNI